MKFLSALISLLILSSIASAQSKKTCSIGSTSGIFHTFEKSVGSYVISPLSGPVENMIVGVSIKKSKGFIQKPIPGFQQSEVTKKDFYTVRLALFTKNDFVSVDAANGQVTSASVVFQTLDQPFDLLSIQGTGTDGDPESYEHQIWLRCD